MAGTSGSVQHRPDLSWQSALQSGSAFGYVGCGGDFRPDTRSAACIGDGVGPRRSNPRMAVIAMTGGVCEMGEDGNCPNQMSRLPILHRGGPCRGEIGLKMLARRGRYATCWARRAAAVRPLKSCACSQQFSIVLPVLGIGPPKGVELHAMTCDQARTRAGRGTPRQSL